MPSQNNQTNKIAISISILAIVLIVAFFIVRSHQSGTDTAGTATTTSTTASSTTATTSEQSSTTGGVTGTGHYTVKILGTVPAAPDFKSPLVCASTIAAAQCAQLQSQAAAIAGQLVKTPEDFGEWIGLGGVRKNAGDYQGAISAWHYMTVLYPTDATAFANLGDLYANYLKDYSKANANYLAAIKINPGSSDWYRNLFTLYTTTTYKPSATAAEDILKAGIAANTKAVDLQVLLARYYKSQGRTADASAEYQAAITNAQSQGNQPLATQIQQEASVTSN